ncbi:MAG TPA: PQQ-binding-like beta-propeller repeat protein [Acidimicrobiales bacterium]|jgi:polyvinyl alcohol dehydrogenase (cytochrome)|nr:PQQ-binding-like beta-propeller repeat protein [Acidimicrobiales bacterium]
MGQRGRPEGHRLTSRWIALAAAAVTAAACSSPAAQTDTTTTIAGSTTTTTVRPSPPEWTTYGHDLANTRTNTSETVINPRSVGGLRVKWKDPETDGVVTTPTVSDGVVYFGDYVGNEWAVQLDSGKVVWEAKLGGGSVVGSPAVVGNVLYAGVGKTLYELSRATGKVIWKATTNPSVFSQINTSPVVVGNLVFEATAQFEEIVGKPPMTFQGNLGAWNAQTGKPVWNFVTTPNNSTSGAGEGIWSTPAVDTQLGLLYVGIGQDISEPAGPLEDSLVAIDYHTGKLKWAAQFTRNDVFGVGHFNGVDADVGASPNLWSVNGHEDVGVGQKNGIYHALDAATGKSLWNTRLTPGSPFGGVLGSSAYVGGEIVASSNIGDPKTNNVTKHSKVFALDPANGKVIWSDTFPGDIYGPVSAVNGVAFVGTTAARYYALDTASGKTLWSYATPAMVGGGGSIIDGNLLWGYGFVLFGPAGKAGIIDFAIPSS